MLDSIPEVLANELVQEIKKMEVDLYNRMSELSKKYGQNHPKMVAIQSELAELRDRKAQEAERIINSLRNEYKLALAKERSLKRALEGQKQESLELNKKAIRYSVLQRQAESSKQMYDLLIKRFKETSLTEEMKTGNIRIIDEAQVPRAPVKPNKKRNLMLGVVLGLMLGVGLAFLLEYMDNTVKLPDELRDQFGIPFLGLVPAFDAREKIDGYEGDLIALHSPTSTPSESFRSIRTAILFSSPDVDPQVTLFTSAGPDEGKSLCAANLAVTMAGAGSRTLLIDCDMRRSRLPHLFGIKKETGLSSVIVGASRLEEEIVATGLDHLDILPGGPLPPNPADLLGSGKMHTLIEGLRKRYKRIILDSPPLAAVTDGAILCQKTDGVVLVIQAGVTPKKLVQSGIDQLRLVGAHILGAVLNGVDVQRDAYYYAGYYYGEYGPDTGKKKRKRRLLG
jgi:capsular exopolysaccharide synthesis family protein